MTASDIQVPTKEPTANRIGIVCMERLIEDWMPDSVNNHLSGISAIKSKKQDA